MSAFSYIIDSILQYAVKNKIDKDPEIKKIIDSYAQDIKKLSQELEILKKERDKKIVNFKNKYNG